jgi:arsenate reductase (glutaredoxin)
MTVTVYGIPTCDTVKKARAWLDANGIAHGFHNYKKSGVDAAKLAGWCETQSWESVLNRAGTTFRKLADADKTGLTQEKAIALMLLQPSMTKRPIVEYDKGILIGFKQDEWACTFCLTRRSTLGRVRATRA